MDDPNLGWRELYQAALLELDRDKLLQYIERAENAIRAHANFRPDPPHHNPHELQAMQDARFKPIAPQRSPRMTRRQGKGNKENEDVAHRDTTVPRGPDLLPQKRVKTTGWT